MTRNAQCGQNATAVPQKADPMLRCGATLVWANSCRERLQQIFGNSVGRGCRERLFWVMQVADCQVEPCYCPFHRAPLYWEDRMRNCIRRREFLTLLGGAAASWPLVGHAQQPKRVGVLMSRVATQATSQSQLTIFMQGMHKLGWAEGQNLQTVVRWSAGDPSLIQAYTTDLVDLFKPDVVLCHSTSNLTALQRATRTIPIVFVLVARFNQFERIW